MIDAIDPTWTREQWLVWVDSVERKTTEFVAILPSLEKEIERRTKELIVLETGLESMRAALNAYNQFCRTASKTCQQG